MKKTVKIISFLLVIALAVGVLTACVDPEPPKPEDTDYAAAVALDMNSETAKIELGADGVHLFVDGDTTHFNVPKSIVPTGILKARYIAINTPESTGKIEDYGMAAKRFTREKLESAVSIVIESDTATWNADSTGSRYVVWVWYKTADSAVYRNLNIEILQNGLAIASNTANNRYGTTAMAALNYAKEQKLLVHSGVKDEEVYRGGVVSLTLRELRCNIADYQGVDVAFEGVVITNDSQTVYVEDYDEELDMYFGMNVYYGFNAPNAVLGMLKVGNRVRIVGNVQYWEAGDSYQVTDLKYNMMKPNDPSNCRLLSRDNELAYTKITADQLKNGKVEIVEEVEGEEVLVNYDFGALAHATSVSMDNLRVLSIYTTNNGGDSDGALTITCQVDDVTVKIRTTVLLDENGHMITADKYTGKVLNVRGIIDCYDGQYQIAVYSPDNIDIVD